jgi:hypothetical protein
MEPPAVSGGWWIHQKTAAVAPSLLERGGIAALPPWSLVIGQ